MRNGARSPGPKGPACRGPGEPGRGWREVPSGTTWQVLGRGVTESSTGSMSAVPRSVDVGRV